MPWAYVITKDHIASEGAEEGTNFNAKGKYVRSRSAREMWPDAKSVTSDPNATRFSLYDDDGECYYEGYYVETDDTDGERVFEPLDWATANAGCTHMKMPNKDGVMVMV